MTRNLKTIFGASVATLLVVHAISVLGASATTSGHFTSNAASGQSKLDITEGTETSHTTTLNAYSTSITCHTAHYTAPNLTSATVTGVTVAAEYTSCTNGSGQAVTVRMNGCHYFFRSRSEGHGTINFLCPAGKKAEVEWSGNTMKFGEQTPKGGAVYTTTEASGLHALTVDITAEGLTLECHGSCQIFGTNSSTGKLTGSVTVSATEVSEPYVGITAT
jgi:hypothetical protein